VLVQLIAAHGSAWAQSETPSAEARIEEYREQGIQWNLEEALITHHLRNDVWETESQLYRLKEQAQGTNWTKVADKHLQNLQSGPLTTTQQNRISEN